MSNSNNDGVIIPQWFFYQTETIHLFDLFRIGIRIDHVHLYSEIFQFIDNIHHFRITDIRHILFKRHSHHQNTRPQYRLSHTDQFFHQLFGNISAHRVVDKTSGTDDLTVIFQFIGFVYQIVRVYSDTVAPY